MKKINWCVMIAIFAMISLPVTANAANACSATVDKNGYCDETGEYHDPSMNTIKNSNCTAYKKDIVAGYCLSICREDATTKFPNKVPVLAVDQYDSILGGNHFIWEEITTSRSRECETTINWEKWKREWEEATGTAPGRENDGGSIGFLVLHIAREDHQRNSDVSVCEFLRGKKFTGQYAQKNKKFYDNFDTAGNKAHTGSISAQDKLVQEAGNIDDKDYLLEYYGCETVNRKATTLKRANGGYITINDIPSSQHKKYCTDQLSASQKKNYSYYGTTPFSSGGSTGSMSGYYCNFIKKCANGSTPNSKGQCPKYNCNGKVNIWSQVEFNKLKEGVVSTHWELYCKNGESTIPYNALDYDKNYGDYKPENAIGGTNGYQLSLNALKNKIKELESILRKCNTSGSSANDKADTSSITVNYLDNPTNTYKRNVLLNKTRIGDQKTSGYTTKASNSTIYNTTCATINASQLNGLITLHDLKTILGGSTTCQKREYTNLKNYANTAIYTKIEESFQYKMPSNTNRYVQKTDGKAVDRVTGTIASNKTYIDIGYPNYPVSFSTPTGTYPMSLTYKNIGIEGHFVKNATYSCKYKVINRIIPCVGEDCDSTINPPDSGNNKSKGVNVIYRPISLINPFPGESGNGRDAGSNWSSEDITDYITNNRRVKQNSIYDQTPLYSFTLTASSINKIKDYNAKTNYDDFNLKCNQPYGKRCRSDFLKSIANYGVTVNEGKCYNVGTSSFYSCAQKDNQDNIKCYWKSKDKELECVNCSNGEGHENDAICKEGSGK